MTDKAIANRTLERKGREAEALKANMKKRKEQARLLANPVEAPRPVQNESND